MTITTGDCVEVMAGMEPDSIDAIVTDPPYGLRFMGKGWDDLDAKMTGHVEWGATTSYKERDSYQDLPKQQRWHQRWATEALRVAKPGAYLLAFGGTRTVHRLTVALEDAGWIIRDLLVWAYASGFPKSKASLKPAWEPIVLARKPGPLQELAIDACRLPSELVRTTRNTALGVMNDDGWKPEPGTYETPEGGRWPANVVLTDPVFDGGWDGVVGGGETGQMPASYMRGTDARGASWLYGNGEGVPHEDHVDGYGDTGTYSRFFLIPKASRSDREPLVPGELEERERKGTGRWTNGDMGPVEGNPRKVDTGHIIRRRNTHPTVKPTDLMRHLVRLVTPQGGTVLDPFLGSGSTAIAATMEGFDWVGIEREAEYVRIAEQRLEQVQHGLGL